MSNNTQISLTDDDVLGVTNDLSDAIDGLPVDGPAEPVEAFHGVLKLVAMFVDAVVRIAKAQERQASALERLASTVSKS